MKTSLGFFCIAALTAGCASASSERPALSEKAAEALAKFERTGETQSCLSLTQIDNITPLDNYNFLVRVGVSKFYLNETSGCAGAGRAFNRIQYSLSGGQLCRNQIVEVVDNSTGFTVGSCGLGDFERLEKVDAEASTEPETE